MRMKKLINILLAAAILMITAAPGSWAAGMTLQVDYNMDTNQLSVQGTLERGAYQMVTVLVLPSQEDIKSLTDTSLDSARHLVFPVEADSNGSFSKSLILPGTFETNEYAVYAYNGSSSANGAFIYLNVAVADELLKTAAEKPEGAFGAYIYENAKDLGINTAAYYDNSAYINAGLYHFQPAGGYKTAAFADQYYIAYATCLYNGKKISLDDLLKNYGTRLQVDYAAFTALEAPVKAKLDELLAAVDYRTNSFPDAYKNNFVLAKLKAAKSYEELKAAMLDNLTDIGISTVKYEKLTPARQNNVFKTVYQTGNLSTVAAYADAYNVAVDAETPKQNQPGGGSNGGGGNPPMVIPATPAPTLEPEETTAPEAPAVFADIEGHWCRGAVERLAEQGIVSGKTETSYAPEDQITRAEMAKLVAGVFAIEETAEGTFVDVPADAWYAGAVNGASGLGIVAGYADQTFRPGQPITRQDLCVMLYRALRVKQVELSGTYSFPDSDSIGAYAKEAVEAFGANGVMQGDGTGFHPLNSATRAETAVVLDIIMQNYIN